MKELQVLVEKLSAEVIDLRILLKRLSQVIVEQEKQIQALQPEGKFSHQ